MSEITIKGFVFAPILDVAREKLDADAFAELEKELGVEYKSLKLQFFKDYPVSLQDRIEHGVAQAVWGRDDPELRYQFGRKNFESFATSPIGKTTLAMTGKDPAKFMRASIRILKTVMSGMDIDIKDLGEKKFSFRFHNNPYTARGWQGVVDAAMDHTGVDYTVQTIKHTSHDTEYVVSW